jgi:hypothetical protein
MKNFKKSIFALSIALSCLTNGQAQTQAKTESNIKLGGMNEMPSTLRTSMTATVGKQNIQVAIVDGGCVISVPPYKAYRVNASNNSMVEISQAEFGDRVNAGKQSQGVNFGDRVNAGLQQAGSVVSGAAGMLGGAMPGGSIVSAALSAGSSMVNGGASSAAYAATGRTAGWNLRTTETRLQIPDNLPDGDYELTIVMSNGLKDTLKTQVRLGLTIEQGALKTKHDTVKNSISNVR